jgi:Tfp pilus assembly PilM family ATPase
MNLFQRKSLVGLDIRPARLRLLQLRKFANGYQIKQAHVCDLPQKIFQQGKISDFPALLRELAPLIKRLGLHGAVAAIHLPVQLVYCDCIQMPAGLNARAIAVQIKRELSHLKTEVWYSYEQDWDGQSPYMKIRLVAARSHYLGEYLDCIRAAGLSVRIIDVDMYALVRLLLWGLKAEPAQVFAAIIRDNDSAGIIIFTHEDIAFQRFWLSSDDLESRVASSLQFYQEQQGKSVSQLYFCELGQGTSPNLSGLTLLFPKTFLPDELTGEYFIAAGLAMRALSDVRH